MMVAAPGRASTTYGLFRTNATVDSQTTDPLTSDIDALMSLLTTGQFRFEYDSRAYTRGQLLVDVPNSFRLEGTATPIDAAPVPEPATLTLVGSALGAAALRARRRRKTSVPQPDA